MIRYKKNALTLRDNSEENLEEESGGLPFVCYYDESRRYTGNHVPWHWHDWPELNYLETGSFMLHTPDGSHEVRQGEAVFVNRNVLHSYDFPREVNYYSCTFDSRFLAGPYGSFLDRKYFSPILDSPNLPVVHLRPDSANRIRMFDAILQIIDAFREEPFGYEITLRETASRFFLLLLEETKERRAQENRGSGRDLERMRQMMQFVYDHYSEPIGLEEIAGAAGLSTRECTRCFHRAINTPPVRFLIEYRAQMAAMMLARTDESISLISEKCGFLSDSYFGKIFRDIYRCTPRDYRKSQKKA